MGVGRFCPSLIFINQSQTGTNFTWLCLQAACISRQKTTYMCKLQCEDVNSPFKYTKYNKYRLMTVAR